MGRRKGKELENYTDGALIVENNFASESETYFLVGRKFGFIPRFPTDVCTVVRFVSRINCVYIYCMLPIGVGVGF